ncbi:MAG TPA: PA0069 family radical SAM protein [Steroidobacteraceae bacterium]
MRLNKTRGAISNRTGRFEALAVEAVDDGWGIADEPLPPLATTVQPEPAHSVITRNNSPDIPFDQSINPYRGCEHGCVYCVSGDTPILMGDGSQKPLADLSVGDEIYGTVKSGFYRRYVRTHVLAHWRTNKLAWRVRLADGTELVASGDHRFLTLHGWKFVAASGGPGQRPVLTRNAALMGFGAALDSSIASKREIEGQTVESMAGLEIVEIEPLSGSRELFDITTGTGDFIANGVISHNCYARPSHQYMNLSAGLDFETKLFYKKDAAMRLREELNKRSYKCSPINLGANTDPYQPIERKLGVTRSILEVLAESHHPVTIVTKGSLVVRDIDVLSKLAAERLVKVFVSVTTLDNELKRRMEPRAASPAARLAAIGKLADAGIPTGVMFAPVVPAINDHELEAVLDASAAAGSTTAGYVLLRLPGEVKELFYEWLELYYPDRAQKVRSRIQELRGGRDNDPRFGHRMRGQGPWAELLKRRFEASCRRNGLASGRAAPLTTLQFRPPNRMPDQMELW